METVDLPALVAPLLDAWLSGADGILGERLVSVRLHGGLAVGDFAPVWSDVDICAVVESLPGAETLGWLARLGRDLHDRFVREGESGWRSGQAVEVLLLTPAVLTGDDGPVVDLGAASGAARVLPGLPAFERLWAARHGRTLRGRRLAVEPPTPSALHARLRADLAAVRSDRILSPIAHASLLAWMARSLAFWLRGQLLGKTEALRAEQEREPPLHQGFRLAARLRREGSRACAAHADEIRRAFEACAPAVETELRPFVA